MDRSRSVVRTLSNRSTSEAQKTHRRRLSKSRTRTISSSEGEIGSRSPGRAKTVSEFSTPDAEIEFLKSELAQLETLDDPKRLPKCLELALDLGVAYFENGQTNEAETILQRVRSRMADTWEWNQITPHLCIKTLVKALVANNKPDVAFELYAQAHLDVRRVLGREHPWTLQYLNNEGHFHAKNKDWIKAEECFQKAAKSKLHVFGADHYSTLTSLYNVDLISYIRDEDLQGHEAMLLFRLGKFRNIYGDRAEDTQLFARQLITLYLETGYIQAAQDLCLELDIDIESALPPNDTLYAIHLDDIIPERIGQAVAEIEDIRATRSFLNTMTRIPQIGVKLLSAVARTRETLMKWAGIDITEFAKLTKLPKTIDWSEFDDTTTILKIAAELGHEPTIRSFLEKMKGQLEDENKVTDVMQGTLHRASSYGNEIVVRLLLEYGMAVDAEDSTGQSALHKAAQRGHEKTVATLLEFGADPTFRDNFGLTPLDDALKEVHHSIIRLLMESRGALILSSIEPNETVTNYSEKRQIPNLKFVGLQSTTVDFYIDTSIIGGQVDEHRVHREPVEALIAGNSLHFETEIVNPTGERARGRPPRTRRHPRETLVTSFAAGLVAGMSGKSRAEKSRAEKYRPNTSRDRSREGRREKAIRPRIISHRSTSRGRKRELSKERGTPRRTLIYSPEIVESRRAVGATKGFGSSSSRERSRPNIRSPRRSVSRGRRGAPRRRNPRANANKNKLATAAAVGAGALAVKELLDKRPRERDASVSNDSSNSRTSYASTLSDHHIQINRTTEEDYPAPDFRWIHLPANNMEWVEALMTKIQGESREGIRCPNLLKDKLWRRQQHESVSSTVHSRFMKPSCRVISGDKDDDKSMILFMPYIHWETQPERNRFQATVDKYKSKAKKSRFEGGLKEMVKNFLADDREEVKRKKKREKLQSHELNDKRLIKYYLNIEPPLHIRRTLDQFHYYMTDDTEDRDSDQVVSRYFSRRFPNEPVPVMMVDQLWLWIVNKETIVTSFPQRWGKHARKHEAGGMLDMTNVLDSILKHLSQRTRDPLMSVYDLAELIVGRCLGLNHNAMEWAHERYPYLEIFEHSINSIADEETVCFNTFADHDRRYDKYSSTKEKASRKRKRVGPLGDKLEEIFDISQEIDLLKEVKDIRDELNIMRHLFSQQKGVLESFCPAIDAASQSNEESPQDRKPKMIDAINRQARYVESLDQDAKRPYKALEDLLDLKQKQANVSEARSARISGNSITVFTIVTIIFLPASFMASFLALPIAEYPKIDQNFELNYVLKYLIATTVAMAIPFIILALYVNPILRIFKVLLRSMYKSYKISRKIAGVALFAAKVTLRLSGKIIWWQLKNLDKLSLILKLAGKGLLLIWLILVNWKVAAKSVLHYRRAKKSSREQGTEWSKRRFVISELVARRRKKMAEDEEKQNTKKEISETVIGNRERGRLWLRWNSAKGEQTTTEIREGEEIGRQI